MHLIASNWRSAPLSEANRALCAYAEKLTTTPTQMSPADLDTLRSHGFDDRAIHDTTQVISYFNYINRIAEGLGVDHEAWMTLSVEEWLTRKRSDYSAELATQSD